MSASIRDRSHGGDTYALRGEGPLWYGGEDRPGRTRWTSREDEALVLADHDAALSLRRELEAEGRRVCVVIVAPPFARPSGRILRRALRRVAGWLGLPWLPPDGRETGG